jgi:protein-tyrosine-phosphatase
VASGLLFLCARGSGRALLAASLLQSIAGDRFDIWSTPIQDTQEHALVERILQEQGVPLLASDHLIQPTFGIRWDEGIILCSGLADT